MPRKKLTPKLKEQIKKDYKNLKLSDYSGDALKYLQQVRSIANARKAQQGLRIEGKYYSKGSSGYQILEQIAKAKGITLKQLLKDKRYKDSIAKFLSEGLVTYKHSDQLTAYLENLAKSRRIYTNDGNGFKRTTREDAIHDIETLKSYTLQNTDIYLIQYRLKVIENGDNRFFIVPEELYAETDDQEEIESILDDYYPEIIYAKSEKQRKKREQREERQNKINKLEGKK